MQLSKILARGQVTLPRNIRRAAGLEPGDVVAFEVTAPGRVELRALPRLRLSEALERYRVTGTVDDAADRVAWQTHAAQDVVRG